jgi:hypothetical protein
MTFDCPMSEDCPAYDRDTRMCLVDPGDCEFSPVDGEATLASEMSEVRTSDTPAPMTAAMDQALDEIDPEPEPFLDAAARETLTGVEW